MAYLSSHHLNYNAFRDVLLDYYKQRETIEDKRDLYFFESNNNPFRSHFIHDELEFTSSFKDWSYFETLYAKSIILGQLCPEFSSYLDFESSMFACNRFLFPAMNGAQYGDEHASKALYETSLAIVNREIQDSAEE